MSFTLLPAVDVADGRVARLGGGDGTASAAAADPRLAALAFQAAGAEWIHFVDLDAAFGRGDNAELLADLIDDLGVNVELSGGVHDDDSLAWALSTGCDRVVLATDALADRDWCARVISDHGERIAVALDVRLTRRADGSTRHELAARGSSDRVRFDLWDALGQLDLVGCARYIVTDVSRDGTLAGPNVELYRAASHATEAPVIASGGVSAIDDLTTLAMLEEADALRPQLEGVIVGTALSTCRFTLTEALAALRQLAR